MWRRLYLTFPDSDHARQACHELEQEGISREQMHALSGDGKGISDLPQATPEQRQDRVWFWEQFYWNGNLALFGVALIGFLIALFSGAYGWAIVTIAVMFATFLGGNYFASKLPHAHLNQVHEPLQHGEVVLMVDLPPEQVGRVDHAVARRHPEAGGHVVGWTMPGMGI